MVQSQRGLYFEFLWTTAWHSERGSFFGYLSHLSGVISFSNLPSVISLLQAPNYALFISHRHPDSHVSEKKKKKKMFILDIKPHGQAHFNVFTSPRKGQPWGAFSTETVVPAGHTGPFYEESNTEEHDHATKISNTSEPHKAILLGRLRFKPDSLEPTTAK